MTRQLAFDLPSRPLLRRADFVVTPVNALVLAAQDEWGGWPLGKMLLVGPSGSGKSHLAQIWAANCGAQVIAEWDLARLDLGTLPEMPICLEDAEAIGGRSDAEQALFHLHNLQAERGQPLLITAASPPRDWGLRLPDLVSRMQACALTRLDPPDDALLSALLAKLFADRQIAVGPALIPYLIGRMDRSFAAAQALVADLDARALAAGRPITRALAADALDSL